MKRLHYLTLLVLALFAAGCQLPEREYVDFTTFHVTSVKSSYVYEKDGSLNPDIRLMEEPSLLQRDPQTKVASASVADIARNMLGSLNSNKVDLVVGTYTGHDTDMTPLVQSGMLVLPKSGPVKNMILVSHYTIGANYECPSETFSLEAALAAKGYAVVIADYIGFGVTAHRVHPYMHTESTARSVVDMGLAVKPYLERINRKPQSEKVILVGYSQGGSTTLAVMDMIQDEYWDEMPIEKVYCGGGPYDLAATFDFSMQEDVTGIPCAIPMIVQGINEGANLGLKMEDFFMPDLLAHYDEWINSKKYTVSQINTMMNAKALHTIMTDKGRDKTSMETARLYKALMINSVLDFIPKAPIFMFHSKQDDTVPFVNAQSAEHFFKDDPMRYDFGDYGAHAMGCLRFLNTISKEL